MVLVAKITNRETEITMKLRQWVADMLGLYTQEQYDAANADWLAVHRADCDRIIYWQNRCRG
jgi:hypothetical protein